MSEELNIKPWQERTKTTMPWTMEQDQWDLHRAKDAEIAELRSALRASRPEAESEMPSDLLDELHDAVVEAFNQAFAIKDWAARDHWRDVLSRFEDWRARPVAGNAARDDARDAG